MEVSANFSYYQVFIFFKKNFVLALQKFAILTNMSCRTLKYICFIHFSVRFNILLDFFLYKQNTYRKESR